MFKLLVFGVIVYAIYVLYSKGKAIKNNINKSNSKNDTESEEMVECSECGTFVTTKEAFIKDGKYYCSKECMLKE